MPALRRHPQAWKARKDTRLRSRFAPQSDTVAPWYLRIAKWPQLFTYELRYPCAYLPLIIIPHHLVWGWSSGYSSLRHDHVQKVTEQVRQLNKSTQGTLVPWEIIIPTIQIITLWRKARWQASRRNCRNEGAEHKSVGGALTTQPARNHWKTHWNPTENSLCHPIKSSSAA